MAQALFYSSSLSSSSAVDLPKTSAKASFIFGSQFRSLEFERGPLRFWNSFNSKSSNCPYVIPRVLSDSHPFFKRRTYFLRLKTSMQHSRRNPNLRLKALMESPALTQEIIDKSSGVGENASNHFKELRRRFLGFKKDVYLQNLEHYQSLSEVQTPKFMVIACADSRVCPSSILGFQPGEAFVVRNVANLVPPHENGPSETNAALEFAVNSLEVENILVVGHSCCGGIKALMSFEDEVNSDSSSFIKSWVVVGKSAKLKTKAASSNLNFDQQCRHCEKESINRSLSNLLTYPWVEDRVTKGTLSIHGGYYDFIDCTFEKWTLDYKGSNSIANGEFSINNREFWT